MLRKMYAIVILILVLVGQIVPANILAQDESSPPITSANAARLTQVQLLDFHIATVESVVLNSDQTILWSIDYRSGSVENILRSWNMDDGTEIAAQRISGAWYNTRLLLSPDDEQLLILIPTIGSLLMNLASGASHTIGNVGAVQDAAFQPQGNLLAVSFVGGDIGLYSRETGRRVGTLSGHVYDAGIGVLEGET